MYCGLLRIVASRLGRTEYQLLLMKISWWDRNVKIGNKVLVVIYEFLTCIDTPTKWIYFLKCTAAVVASGMMKRLLVVITWPHTRSASLDVRTRRCANFKNISWPVYLPLTTPVLRQSPPCLRWVTSCMTYAGRARAVEREWR